MGIYNNVKFKKKCKCGFLLTDWQTKDSVVIVRTKSGKTYFLENAFHFVLIEDIEKGTIHTMCSKCNKFVELEVKKGKVKK